MFTDIQLDRYADVLLWGLKTARATKFQKMDVILIRYHVSAIRLAEVIYAKLLDLRMNPVIRSNLTTNMERHFYERSDSKQLVFQVPGDEELFNRLNGSIFLYGPESVTHLSHIDPKRIAKTAVARKYLRDILDRREEEGIFSWTLGAYPTEEPARHAKMSVAEYAGQIAEACYLNHPDPVSEWKTVYRSITEIKKWLNSLKVRSFHIESESIDLVVTPGEHRRWIGISGHNIPSFEIFLSPDWRGINGIYFANQPSYRSGNYVKDVRLEFKKGVAVNAHAQIGEEFVRKQLATDKGANKVGEFSLTDKRFSKIDRFMANTLFDENYGGEYGNCHIAVGSSYSDTYSGNPKELTKAIKTKLGFNDSALHWDLVNTENKRVTAHLTNGEKLTIYEKGQFAY